MSLSAGTWWLKIVYFSQSILPSRYANSIHVMKMCNALASVAGEVMLLARRGRLEMVEDVFSFYGISPGLQIRRLPWPNIWGGASLYSMAGLVALTASGCELVYGRYVRGCYLASLIGLPVIFEAHITSDHWGSSERWMLERLMRSRNLAGVVVITEPLREHYARVFDIDERRILTAPDGADVSDSLPLRRANARLQVGYIGHLYPGRGLELIETLASRCPWADFHIVGGMNDDIRVWRERSKDIDNLVFHGFVSPAKTVTFRERFDVALAPYQNKVTIAGKTDTTSCMSPLKLFEYMASGNAIVCSDLPVLHEVMHHEHNCLMCPPDDGEAWCGALQRLRDDKALRERLGATALEELQRRYSWRSRAHRILGHFGYLR